MKFIFGGSFVSLPQNLIVEQSPKHYQIFDIQWLEIHCFVLSIVHFNLLNHFTI